MVANIAQSILFLLLTVGLQYVGLQFLAESDSEQEMVKLIFPYILPAVFLIIAFCQWRKIAVFKKRAWMAKNPLSFTPDLIDCYVRFTGKLTNEQTCRMPVSGSECVYYTALVVAEYQVKQRKPAKGWETVRKPLLREQSAAELELRDKNCQVSIKVEEFIKSNVRLRTKEKTQINCPANLKIPGYKKHKKYNITEQFLFRGDNVTVQGRLTLNRDGRLFIRPTRRLGFPSFLVVQTRASRFIRDIVDKAQDNVWSRRIRVFFLLLNIGLIIYLWHVSS
ncbi:MAG: hypothetical protein D3905_11955 [Candidatus Electrothrix sp. AS4_5]|nr:hypothetical protein [Candidatus Electrothrix gigas]